MINVNDKIVTKVNADGVTLVKPRNIQVLQAQRYTTVIHASLNYRVIFISFNDDNFHILLLKDKERDGNK
jgi:hypothetical protein